MKKHLPLGAGTANAFDERAVGSCVTIFKPS